MDNKDKNKPQQIKIELDDSVGQGEYVNFAIVCNFPCWKANFLQKSPFPHCFVKNLVHNYFLISF